MAKNIFKTQTVENIIEQSRRKYVDPLLGEAGKKRIDIDSYKANFDGNARAYLFLCDIQFPTVINSAVTKAGNSPDLNNILKTLKSLGEVGLTSTIKQGFFQPDADTKYLVRSASLPEVTLEETSTYFCGRQYKIPSVRRTQDWNVSFYIDSDAYILKKFLAWNILLNDPDEGVYVDPSDFMTDQSVTLLGLDGGKICTYNLKGAWPKSIGQVELDYANNEMATLEVSFTYQYLTITELHTLTPDPNYGKGLVGMGINSIVNRFLKR